MPPLKQRQSTLFPPDKFRPIVILFTDNCYCLDDRGQRLSRLDKRRWDEFS